MESVRLKSEGLQHQSDCLVGIEKSLVTIQGAISEESGTIDGDTVEAAVVKAKSIIRERQKRLKIADEEGWQAVSFYDGASAIGDDASDSSEP